MLRAVGLLIDAAGIEKVRVTGGEPLLTPKFDELLPALLRLPLSDVSVTTNGQLLNRKAATIIGSGLRRINVSLDTLDAQRFRAIARGGDLATVLEGIERMRAAGLRIKINMVPMRHRNEDQILPMLDYCLERGIELRYIELMNMGHLRSGNQYHREFVGMDEILETIAVRHEFVRTDAPYDSTAVRFAIPDKGSFGVIANETEPFCRSCTRLRLSSNGQLFGCLSNARSHDIKPLLALPEHQALVELQGLLVRALADKQSVNFTGEVTVMKFIGG
jgi:cyclic pyranopterin phosphate synthase